ncbi:MAG: hypothetical protein IPO78_16930 [Saprospiraceae bacterium]|nr:hypothetical protein [Saprospiraceae bacterium]
MLQSLLIKNYAIIDQLEIEWQQGMTVITGETGAGKIYNHRRFTIGSGQSFGC